MSRSNIVSNTGITERLYRYRSVAKAEELLRENILWFSSLEKFNDPFEGRYILALDENADAYRPFLREMFAQEPNTTSAMIENRVKQYLGRGIDYIRAELGETIRFMQDQVRSRWSFCCFSRVPDDVLMWSHYADCHQGCCIEFSLLPVSDLGMLQEVKYTREFPRATFVNAMSDEQELAVLAITSKFECWKYEREVRLVRHQSPGGVPFSRRLIKRAIFGINTPREEKERLIAASGGSGIKLAQASRGSGYDIIIEPL